MPREGLNFASFFKEVKSSILNMCRSRKFLRQGQASDQGRSDKVLPISKAISWEIEGVWICACQRTCRCTKLFATEEHMSLVMRKPAFCICENKDADQLRGNREADQRLCFRYTDSTTLLLPKCEISSLKPSSVAVQPGLCQTWSETPKTGFLTTRLI